ncbi:MAG: putative sensory box sensor histidine kinase [Caulobacteraceae bacterium]|nr:putative sensory box sensor histidine kinase [Caulobacteraceae bacterium]
MAYGLGAAAFGLGLAQTLNLLSGHGYPYQCFFLGVIVGAALGGAAAALTAAAGMGIVGWLLFTWDMIGDSERFSLPVHLAAVAIVAAITLALRHVAWQVGHERTKTDSALSQLKVSQEHSRRFVDLTPHIAWTADPQGRLTLLPKKISTLTGAPQEDLLGEGWKDLVHPDDRQAVDRAWAEALATGEPYLVEFRGRRLDGAYVWMRSQAYAAKDANGRITCWYGLSENINTRKTVEEDRELLIREVDHRSRNILTVLQGLVSTMPKDDPKRFAEVFSARLVALANAHGLLADRRWRGVDIRSLLEGELAPYGLERTEFAGGSLIVGAERVQQLSMILHELATNSAKYGCLSVPAGRLSVQWRSEGSAVRIEWIESGGPCVSPPTRHGFGSTLIQSIAGRGRGESVRYDWRPEGLHCAIVLANLVDG